MIVPSVIIAGLIVIILVLLALLHQKNERVFEGKVRELKLAETVKDLRTKLQPFRWRLPENQITTQVEKGRPDVIRRVPTRPPGEKIVITGIDDIPDWVRDDVS